MRNLRSLTGAFVSAGFLVACGGGNALSPSTPMSLSATRAALLTDRPLTQDVLYTFKGGRDGAGPFAGLLAGKNGEFYGTTYSGGSGPSGGYGTVFDVSSTGAENILYTFQGDTDGGNPEAGLIAGSGGVLYGATTYGGGSSTCTGGCGTVFALTPSGSGYTETVLYAFKGGKDGAYPLGTLLLGKSGVLYGTTNAGGGGSACTPPSGIVGCGTAYKLTPSGSRYTEKVLYRFGGAADGAFPKDALIANDKGDLYGTAYQGGAGTACTGGCGIAFKLTPAGKQTVLYNFQGGAYDGELPRAALLGVANGNLVGATTRGGSAAGGTIYELVRSGSHYTERILYFFTGGKDAAVPDDEHGIYADKSGDLFGTTIAGGKAACGSNPCGTVFELTPAGSGYTETVLYRFQGAKDGAVPRASVVADSAGNLYGTAEAGANKKCAGGCGIVFKVSR